MNPFEKHGITHLSPSSLNVFAAQPALWVMERLLGRKRRAGAAAHRGTAVEAGVCAALMGAPMNEAVGRAEAEFTRLTALSGDPRRYKERRALADMVEKGVGCLKGYGQPTDMQRRVKWCPDGLEVPIVGYYDLWYEDVGTVIDIKTTNRIPNLDGLEGPIEGHYDDWWYEDVGASAAHARQVGFYAGALGDNVSAGLAYVSPKMGVVLELKHVRKHRDALRAIADRLRSFLEAAENAEHAASMVVPDVDSFWWSDPQMRRAAHEVYGV